MLDVRRMHDLMQESEQLNAYLRGLTNSEFRLAGRVLADSLLVEADRETFWSVFRTLFLSDRKAYLGTLLKALAQRRGENLFCEEFAALGADMTELDVRKTLLTLLPLLDTPEAVDRLLLQFGQTDARQRIPYLLQVGTVPCLFLLLGALRYVEHDRELLVRTCRFLMKKGGDREFAFCSIIRLSFALDEVRGSFSLKLEPYQLARTEQRYEVFAALLGGKSIR